jgi:hypothetical protein
MIKIGDLIIEKPTKLLRQDGEYTCSAGTYAVNYTVNDLGVGGYMTEVPGVDPGGHRCVIFLGGGWFSNTNLEVPNYNGLGKFESTVDTLPVVGKFQTQLVPNPQSLQ